MRSNRLAVHAIVIAAIALVGFGARSGSPGTDPGRDSAARAEEPARGAQPARLVYYGRLGTPFLARDARLALSGAPLTPRATDAPRGLRRSCPATAPAATGATQLARRAGD